MTKKLNLKTLMVLVATVQTVNNGQGVYAYDDFTRKLAVKDATDYIEGIDSIEIMTEGEKDALTKMLEAATK